MSPHDMVYKEIYSGALRAGAKERFAKDAAVMGLDDFKKGRFKKPFDLIKSKITEAKKASKNAGK